MLTALYFKQRICWKNERTYIHLFRSFEKESILDYQVRWEYLKYEIRKVSNKFSKAQAKKLRLERVLLEKKQKNYNDCKTPLEQIYKIKANGITIRSKCEWYEDGEISSKFFLNL